MFTRCASLWKMVSVAALLAGYAIASTAVPGTLNYLEGQVTSSGQTLTSKSAGSVQVGQNQVLQTSQGRAEMLLTPGAFLRVGDNSAVRMISPNLMDTRVEVMRGQAMVEVAQLFKENQIRVQMGGASTMLTKAGLYAFNADRGMVSVFDGKAEVTRDDQQVELKKGREVSLQGPLKAEKFDRDAAHDSLYAWSSLRSKYEAQASMQSARMYVAGGPGWYGPGWYWNPWWDMYGFVPGAGIAYSPFGWPFYSPIVVYRVPVFRSSGRSRVVAPAPAMRSGGFARGAPMGRTGVRH
ncbi:MAG TPA: FecR domain-containing protein [Bryobacteraceae bacterium]|nr:FecR domain-containing protein [Bryobacteraceae bacterium]